MIYTGATKKAMKLIYEKHNGQLDKSGLPYVYHPLHVAESMDDENATLVALLHDIVEDTDMTFEELEKLNFNQEVIEALKLLTHEEGGDYFDYIKRISTNELAVKVKLADLKHNSDLTRLNQVTEKDLQRIEKYRKSIAYLTKLKE